MKKKNLLALSGLVLSLGLTVSSCAGQPGEKGETGDKGDQGETGPQGPQGQAGQDGKSFVQIIVRDWKVTGGEITQDKYFVEMGKKESVTFTFTPDSEDAEVVVNIEINGEVVNPVLELVPGEDGKVTWSYEVPDDMGGLQLTAATFTTVDDYALDQLYVYYSTLTANDNQLVAFENEDGTWTADADQVKGEWFNSDVVKTVTSEAGKIATEVAKLTTAENPNPTATEKLAKVNELLPAAQEAVKAAYDKAVTEVKEAAIEAIEDLSDEVSSDNYKDDDRKAILDEGKAAINAATSIEDITTLVNKVEVEDKLELGTYNELYSRKNAAFDKIEQALEDAYDLVPELEDTEDPDYEELKTALSTWKIDLDTVTPKATADEYLTKVSAAKSLEEIPVYTEDSADDAEVSYKEGDVVLAVEGADAVAGSVEDLKDTLVANIRASYEKEVDDSKAISTTSAKESLKGVINNSIDTWLTVNEDSSLLLYTESTLAYVNAGGGSVEAGTPGATVTVTGSGLIGYIENVIGTKGNANYNAAFQAERLQNALAGAKTELAAAVKAEKDADSDYAKAIAWSKVTSGDNEGKYLVSNPKIGVKDYEISNPFVTGLPTTEPSDKKWYATGLVEPSTATVGTYKGYSVDDYYASLFPTDGSLPESLENAKDAVNPVLVVKKFIADEKENIKTIHTEATEFYMGKQKAELKFVEGDEEDSILSKEWNKLFPEAGMKADDPYTMSDVSSARKGMETAKTLLFSEDGLYTNVMEFVDAKNLVSADEDWVDDVWNIGETDDTKTSNFTSELRKQYGALKEKVILGTATESEVEDFIKDLTDLYEADVASYKEDAISQLKEDVQNRKSTGTGEGVLNTAQIRLMENRLAEALEFLGTNDLSSVGTTYDAKTVKSINDWSDDAHSYVIPGNETNKTSSAGSIGESAYETVQAKFTAKLEILVNDSDSGLFDGSDDNTVTSIATVLEDATIGTEDEEKNKVVLDFTSVDGGSEWLSALKLNGTYDKTAHTLTYEVKTMKDVDTFIKDMVSIHDTIVDMRAYFTGEGLDALVEKVSDAILAQAKAKLVGLKTSGDDYAKLTEFVENLNTQLGKFVNGVTAQKDWFTLKTSAGTTVSGADGVVATVELSNLVASSLKSATPKFKVGSKGTIIEVSDTIKTEYYVFIKSQLDKFVADVCTAIGTVDVK